MERVRSHLETSYEGSRLKGEVTVVISPGQDTDELEATLRGQKFDPNRDAQVRINILDIARRLNEEVEMGEKDFRNLLKTLFPDVPSYHLRTIARMIRQGGRKYRTDVISERVGGFL